MAHTITVEELHGLCAELIRKGKGKKKIMISNDDEGNGFHELFFAFTEDMNQFLISRPYLPYGVTQENIDDYVILG